MQACALSTYVADVVREMRSVSRDTADQTKDCFGDPFGKLTDEDCAQIADTITAGRFSDFFVFGHGVILTWANIDGKLLLDIIAQGEQYANIIAAINDILKGRGMAF